MCIGYKYIIVTLAIQPESEICLFKISSYIACVPQLLYVYSDPMSFVNYNLL